MATVLSINKRHEKIKVTVYGHFKVGVGKSRRRYEKMIEKNKRRVWDSNPRAQEWTTAFRVQLVMTTSITLHLSLIYYNTYENLFQE